MRSVPGHRVELALSVLGRVHTLVAEDGPWRDALADGCLHLFDAHAAVFAELTRNGGDHPRIAFLADAWHAADPARRAALQQHVRDACPDDPFLAAYTTTATADATAHPDAPVLTAHRADLIPDPHWPDHPFARRLVTPLGLDACMYSFHPLPTPGWFAQLAVYRNARSAPFTDHDRDLLDLFHRQLAGLYRRTVLTVASTTADLPPRLADVLHCLLAGDAPKQIAFRLDLSVHTVRGYVKQIYRRLGVNDRTELLKRFLTRSDATPSNPPTR